MLPINSTWRPRLHLECRSRINIFGLVYDTKFQVLECTTFSKFKIIGLFQEPSEIWTEFALCGQTTFPAFQMRIIIHEEIHHGGGSHLEFSSKSRIFAMVQDTKLKFCSEIKMTILTVPKYEVCNFRYWSWRQPPYLKSKQARMSLWVRTINHDDEMKLISPENDVANL